VQTNSNIPTRKFRISFIVTIFFSLISVIFCGGCNDRELDLSKEMQSEINLPNPFNDAISSSITTEPTSVIALAPISEVNTDDQTPGGLNQYIEPLRFSFPTIAPESVSSWRPPLYPVPWEPTIYDHFYFWRPIGANDINWPLARYRYGGVFFSTAHTGIDIPAPKGTPIMATGDGIVTWAGYGLYFLKQEYRDPYGIAVAIKHDFGYNGKSLYTVYGHMDQTYVFRGQRVRTGDILGLVGETGNVTGPHLHLEVRIGDNNYFESRNPELWIAPPQGWGILAGRVMASDGNLEKGQRISLRHIDSNTYYYVDTYGDGPVNSDPYYRENFVIGDLPAGIYSLHINYDSVIYKNVIEIRPGEVSYFKFTGKFGFDFSLPPTPSQDFFVSELTAIP